MKKIPKLKTLFLVMALAVGFISLPTAVQAVAPETSTVAISVATDVDNITATNRILNVSIMGMDEDGNVDTMGGSGGGRIIASVQSVLGTVTSGGATTAAAAGTFAITSQYFILAAGVGPANVVYPADATGTDVVDIALYNSWQEVAGGAWYTEKIASTKLSIEVVAATATSGVLHIRSFTRAATDTVNGVTAAGVNLEDAAGGDNEAEDNGIAVGAARMTANVAGGQFQIRAYTIAGTRAYTLDGNASGTVTLTLTGSPLSGPEALGGNTATPVNTYTTAGVMANGVCNIVVPSGWTKAGRYEVTATMDTLVSVPNKISDNDATRDFVSIVPEPTYAGISLECNMTTVSVTTAANLAADVDDDGITFDPTFTARMLDQWGNRIVAGTSPGTTIKVTDASVKMADFNIVIGAAANNATSQQDGSTFSTGLASLTASDPANLLIPATTALPLKILARTSQLAFSFTTADDGDTGIAPAAQQVGQSFFFVDAGGFGVDANGDGDALDGTEMNTLVGTDSIKVTNLTPASRFDSVTAAVADTDPDRLSTIFTVATVEALIEANGFLVQHSTASYADAIVVPASGGALALTPLTASKAYIKKSAGTGAVVSSVNATELPRGTR